MFFRQVGHFGRHYAARRAKKDLEAEICLKNETGRKIFDFSACLYPLRHHVPRH